MASDGTDDTTFWEPLYASLIELSRPNPDYRAYLAMLEHGARAGDDHARYGLSSWHLRGAPDADPAWRQDVPRGLRLLRLASRSVHMAMTELASILENGEYGVRRNEKQAFALFARAAEHGSIAARYHVGRCYYYGVGTPVDRRKAAAKYRAAAALGFPVMPYYSPEYANGAADEP